ncbi:hypothetical protein [Bdellovibrio sp. ArHS]|uniref:hypothetical protein n=1 Tax=Bdellovibrio sp. ArHS TaxID=1569284 RepID=UPI000A812D20|nr:hypothetical protein [Bdellovibrio sp. ArHS]
MDSLQVASSAIAKFKTFSEELCEVIEQEGFVVRPYSQDSLPYFRQLSETEQLHAVENLENYIRICKSVHDVGGEIKDASLFVRKALQFYGYQYDPKILELVQNEYLTEIYNLSNIQLFRSFSYFQYASYTIEDIYTRPWIHLYERDPEVTAKLVATLTSIITGEKKTLEIDVEEHLLIEKASLERLAVSVRVLYAMPLLKEGKTAAYLVIARCKPILN